MAEDWFYLPFQEICPTSFRTVHPYPTTNAHMWRLRSPVCSLYACLLIRIMLENIINIIFHIIEYSLFTFWHFVIFVLSKFIWRSRLNFPFTVSDIGSPLAEILLSCEQFLLHSASSYLTLRQAKFIYVNLPTWYFTDPETAFIKC